MGRERMHYKSAKKTTRSSWPWSCASIQLEFFISYAISLPDCLMQFPLFSHVK